MRTGPDWSAGRQPDSAGDLLRRALERIGVSAVLGESVADIRASYDLLRDSGCGSLVGVPVQIL